MPPCPDPRSASEDTDRHCSHPSFIPALRPTITSLSMAETNEMACVYAALVLHDDGIAITEDKIKTLTEAAGITVEPYWPSMFAKLLETVKIDDLINNIGAAPASGAAPAAGAAGGDAAAAEEEKKEESESEEEEEMDFDLFD
ncbi:unnamed protein product [Chondrus crispus]|uniref:60S acidic ribosomal protein P1 n=1 Tax=Chondrus crispus TaxID=2769 RepID=R7QCC6_CHOCR|nr:unnamed protein product [Chondrus crispus]CDF35729.1 unnamed protein product [Chondrus crispus]|eukprot:XP_005715548.1 unnamed protein product [Chondrus crispus]